MDATRLTPKVMLDPTNERFEFAGSSLPLNALDFYNPILNWFNDYVSAPNDKTKLIFKMEYFNTNTSKVFLDIFLKLEELIQKDKDIKVAWHYREEDTDMKQAGEIFSEWVKIPFEFIEMH
ncbi:MAG: DUF1987 domain-containing protein [Bacteroidetes bacterium]|nr:DUF1987 domain-containing protein [Bacteroidota bacterium]